MVGKEGGREGASLELVEKKDTYKWYKNMHTAPGNHGKHELSLMYRTCTVHQSSDTQLKD